MRERLRWTCCTFPFPRKKRLTPGPFCSLATETQRRDSRFSPRSFFGSIKNIDGRIFVSLDTCFTGMSNRGLRRVGPRLSRADALVGISLTLTHASLFFSYHRFIIHIAINVCSLISTSWYLYEINSHFVYNIIFLNFRCNKNHIIFFNIIICL